MSKSVNMEAIPRRQMLTDDVYERLRSLLVQGVFAPGERIKIDELASKLAVSNTPIRQALVRLEGDGLVYQEAHRGFLAMQLMDAASIRQVYDARSTLESVSAERAALQGDSDRGAELRSILRGDLSGEPGTPGTDELFHLRIAALAGNQIVVEMMERLFNRTRAYRLAMTAPSAGEHTDVEHEAIVAAIERGDGAQARAAMRTHLTEALQRLESVVR